MEGCFAERFGSIDRYVWHVDDQGMFGYAFGVRPYWIEDDHLKTDTLYRVCRAVHRSFDEAVHDTVRESKGIQTETVALFIRKRI